MAEVSSIVRTILDFRYFIDESLTFLEHFEGGERDLMRKFTTTQQEIAKIRHNAIEFTRILCDLKKILFSTQTISDFNLSFDFSKDFKQFKMILITIGAVPIPGFKTVMEHKPPKIKLKTHQVAFFIIFKLK